MPNWCYNEIEISGRKEELEELCKKAKTSESIFDFNVFAPPPNKEWDYGWCIKNWGTKWLPSAVKQGWKTRQSNNVLYYCFDTAWSPPIEFMQRLAKQYNSLSFKGDWYEPSAPTAGHYRIKAGGLQVHEVLVDYYDPSNNLMWINNQILDHWESMVNDSEQRELWLDEAEEQFNWQRVGDFLGKTRGELLIEMYEL